MKGAILFAVIFLFSNSTIFSQKNCGTETHTINSLIKKDIVARNNNFIFNFTDGNNLTALKGIIKIPVVVHIVYSNDSENLWDDEIHSQINATNIALAGMNSDTVPSEFISRKAGDCQIQLDLKEITRTKTEVPLFFINITGSCTPSNCPIKFDITGGRSGFPNRKYLNIWVGNIIEITKEVEYKGLMGFATFPNVLNYSITPDEYDGIVINYRDFGVLYPVDPNGNKGKTLTHELGHWLNLKHLWGDNMGACGDDGINDTPRQDSANKFCPVFPVPSCDSSAGGEMFMNYLDYVNDECMVMFTNDQKEMMRSMFSEKGGRSYFLNSYSENKNLIEADKLRNDLNTPYIVKLTKYSVMDTNTYAYLEWNKIVKAKKYKITVKNLETYKVITKDISENYCNIRNLNPENLYAIEIQSVLKDGKVSTNSIPYFFKIDGLRLNKFKEFNIN